MRGPFRDKSIFVQLLGGTMSILTAATLLWLVADLYFLNAAGYSDTRRWIVSAIALDATQARFAEREFVDHDATGDAFFDTGNSSALAQQRTETSELLRDIDSLEALSNPDQRTEETRIRAGVTAYDNAVNDLVRLIQQRGHGTRGVEGQWRAAVDAIAARMRSAGGTAARDAETLVSAQRDYLDAPDQTGALAVISAQTALAGSARDVAGGAALVARSDSLFRAYRDLEDQIGQTEDQGLQAKSEQAVDSVVPAIDSILSASADASNAAMTRLRLATPVGLLLTLLCAGIFLYFFARSVSQTTTNLGSAAAQIGRGQFNIRVHTNGQDELSRLGKDFNQMAENLGALVGSVQKSGIQINTSVMEIAATARQQQTTATEIAATTSEVGATAREISATSQELSKNMTQVAQAAERTANLAGSGQSGIGRMSSTMHQISTAAEAISARLATLSEKASNINTVVTTITKVADQTNLLSLNAAIEAEKAGEYGRGFAVVASEIRRLADQTALATGDIERIVKEIQSAVTAGVMGMDKFSDEVSRGVEASRQVGEQLTGIIQQVQTLTPNFEMVSEGMRTQAESAQQISDSLSQLVAASQQTAESLVQSNKAIEQLNEASRGLQTGVSRFTTAA